MPSLAHLTLSTAFHVSIILEFYAVIVKWVIAEFNSDILWAKGKSSNFHMFMGRENFSNHLKK